MKNLENQESSCEINNETNDVEQNSNRQGWTGNLQFLMSCIALSVGLGNIWRFPFTAYENGGGAFLIPYIIVLLIIGKPMYYLEATIGQFASKSSVKIWQSVPAFLGIGVGQAFAATSVLTYYSALIALSIYYLVASFKSPLPWSYCREEWEANCINSTPSALQIFNDLPQQSSSELYYTKTVLRELEKIDDGIGVPSWRLSLCLVCSWTITFLVIIKGVKSLGKASYFFAIFPYLMLITLLIRAVTLEGSVDGIIFFLKPNWSELLNLKVWKEAVVQCFFSLTVAMGPIITFSSYNKFSHNVYRDAMIVTTLDTFTSLLAGITIFGILGNLAHNLNIENIDQVVRGGTGLAFISYPEAIAKFTSVPQIFSVCFFLMLLVLGTGSIVALQSTIVTIISDHYKFKRFWLISLIICVAACSFGLIYVTPGGQWILNLVDYYAGTFVLFCLAVFEIIGIAWIYGLRNYCDDIEFMTNRKLSIYWRICWGFITPTLLLIIFIFSIVDMEPLSYGGTEYPEIADIMGYVLLAVGFAQFPLWGIWYFVKNSTGSFSNTLRSGLRPHPSWGPAEADIKVKWLLYKRQLREEREKERATKNMSKFRQKVYYVFGLSK